MMPTMDQCCTRRAPPAWHICMARKVWSEVHPFPEVQNMQPGMFGQYLPTQGGRARFHACLAVQMSSREVSPVSGKTCSGSQTYLALFSVRRTSFMRPGVGEGTSQPSARER
uniref:Uncharacterized protein n=1 Tax=Anopheles albimanus TaxID=7167 RepID=A0A182FWF4_ANOAL